MVYWNLQKMTARNGTCTTIILLSYFTDRPSLNDQRPIQTSRGWASHSSTMHILCPVVLTLSIYSWIFLCCCAWLNDHVHATSLLPVFCCSLCSEVCFCDVDQLVPFVFPTQNVVRFITMYQQYQFLVRTPIWIVYMSLICLYLKKFITNK
jgi:hypothetical protein